ncbi:hypothetical protein SDC9_164845 [bioreactor metagenome]|uniref:Uncharacterized protein n=1 Tax=bioreactor metagenome TaxID=1076179 RepID=A0A645FSR2_9ZZZZ
MLALFNASFIAGTGPSPITEGSTPPCPTDTNSAIGFNPCSLTAFSDATSTILAPSFIPDAFPAVTVPSFLNAGLNFESFSKSVFLFGYSSVSTITEPFLVFTSIGTISSTNLLLSIALIAFC